MNDYEFARELAEFKIKQDYNSLIKKLENEIEELNSKIKEQTSPELQIAERLRKERQLQAEAEEKILKYMQQQIALQKEKKEQDIALDERHINVISKKIQIQKQFIELKSKELEYMTGLLPPSKNPYR